MVTSTPQHGVVLEDAATLAYEPARRRLSETSTLWIVPGQMQLTTLSMTNKQVTAT